MSSIQETLLSTPTGIESNLKNIYAYFSSLSPLYISAYLLISSLSNGDIGKASMYLAGLVLVLLIHSIIAMSIGGEYEDKFGSSKYKLECNFIQVPLLSNYMVPNLNSTLWLLFLPISLCQCRHTIVTM